MCVRWSSILQDKVQSEKDTYLSSLARIQGQLHGLQVSVVIIVVFLSLCTSLSVFLSLCVVYIMLWSFINGLFVMCVCPQNALAKRTDVGKAALSARELWLACESLRNALRCVWMSS